MLVEFHQNLLTYDVKGEGIPLLLTKKIAVVAAGCFSQDYFFISVAVSSNKNSSNFKSFISINVSQ